MPDHLKNAVTASTQLHAELRAAATLARDTLLTILLRELMNEADLLRSKVSEVHFARGSREPAASKLGDMRLTCPCGASICSRGTLGSAWEAFVVEHREHMGSYDPRTGPAFTAE